jgi:cysteine-rich repeat protein
MSQQLKAAKLLEQKKGQWKVTSIAFNAPRIGNSKMAKAVEDRLFDGNLDPWVFNRSWDTVSEARFADDQVNLLVEPQSHYTFRFWRAKDLRARGITLQPIVKRGFVKRNHDIAPSQDDIGKGAGWSPATVAGYYKTFFTGEPKDWNKNSCGDGEITGDEECDDKPPNNRGCNSACKLAFGVTFPSLYGTTCTGSCK